MNVTCISDLHGELPEDGVIPPSNLLIIAGDICPCRFSTAYESPSLKALNQSWWLRETFLPWLQGQPVANTIATWGNHDWIGEKRPDLVPTFIPWKMLNLTGCEINGFQCFGIPHQLRFHDWAFNADEPQLERLWDKIPTDTDILVLHGPPHGYGDHIGPKGAQHHGSPSLTRWIEEHQPKLVVCGHIHNGHGTYQLGKTTIVNAALLDDNYKMTKKPITLEIKK